MAFLVNNSNITNLRAESFLALWYPLSTNGSLVSGGRSSSRKVTFQSSPTPTIPMSGIESLVIVLATVLVTVPVLSIPEVATMSEAAARSA